MKVLKNIAQVPQAQIRRVPFRPPKLFSSQGYVGWPVLPGKHSVLPKVVYKKTY